MVQPILQNISIGKSSNGYLECSIYQSHPFNFKSFSPTFHAPFIIVSSSRRIHYLNTMFNR